MVTSYEEGKKKVPPQSISILIPRPPLLFVLQFAFSIIHGSRRARKTIFSCSSTSMCYIERKPKNQKNEGGLGARLVNWYSLTKCQKLQTDASLDTNYGQGIDRLHHLLTKRNTQTDHSKVLGIINSYGSLLYAPV